ncbi:hypothetical protein EZJ58_0073 [Sodalis ligni]|uniref:Transposase n=1 Tax=Sodalis ligni TaxID=2697027 RepID=A0A4R1N993_9GAMM|nr:hypothetical protein EZJ58_0073 [Sodalis ligni]
MPCADVERYLASFPGSWSLFYLYLIGDVFSQKIVGYDVHKEESGELATVYVLSERCY